MARSKVINGATVEILIDNSWADVRRTRNCGRISKPLADGAQDGGDRAFRLGFGLRNPVLGERDRSEQRAAPRPEVLRRELLAQIFLDVVVQAFSAQAAEAAVAVSIAEETASSPDREQLTDGVGELLVDEGGADERPVLAAKAEGDSATANADVSLLERGDPEGSELLRVALVADAKPAEVDQADRNRRRPLEGQRLELHVLGHCKAELRQLLGEPDQLVELRLLLLGSKVRVVQVLHPARLVDPRGLELCAGPR